MCIFSAVCTQKTNKFVGLGGCKRQSLARFGLLYRVTRQVVPNLTLTSKQKFCFGLARSGQARPKLNFCFEVNGRFGTTGRVTLLYVSI